MTLRHHPLALPIARLATLTAGGLIYLSLTGLTVVQRIRCVRRQL